MAKNPAQYGLDSVVKEKPVAYDTVKIDYPIDLRLAAECVDAKAEDLADLNPSLLRLTAQRSTIRSPPAVEPPTNSSGGRFHPRRQARLVALSQGAARRNLAAVARTYRTTPTAIAEANDLDLASSHDGLAPETRLIIPIALGNKPIQARTRMAATRYQVRKGDTVASVAGKFRRPGKDVRTWNT